VTEKRKAALIGKGGIFACEWGPGEGGGSTSKKINTWRRGVDFTGWKGGDSIREITGNNGEKRPVENWGGEGIIKGRNPSSIKKKKEKENSSGSLPVKKTSAILNKKGRGRNIFLQEGGTSGATKTL